MTKYAIIVPDGAADEPLAELDSKTPLESARTPNMDKISISGLQGLVQTVPEGMEPGSDVAQMSLLGYDPLKFYSGRAPIEAVARDIQLGSGEWVFRCNLVTIADGRMADHSAGHITTAEAAGLIEELNRSLGSDNIHFYPGISYRHLLVVKGTSFDVETFPPHDNIGKRKGKILPRGKGAEFLIDLMARSQQLFSNHEVNRVRRDLNENEVSSIWLWGQGQKAHLESFKNRFGLDGGVITAVDLVRGLCKLIGFKYIEVNGATGFVDTNYAGKGQAAIHALDKYDIVFVHIEAPDEASHAGDAGMKIRSIEEIDEHIVGPVFEALQGYDKWRILVAPDHPTGVTSGAHSGEAVPFAMAGENVSGIMEHPFGESNAGRTGFKVKKGCELMEYFLKT